MNYMKHETAVSRIPLPSNVVLMRTGTIFLFYRESSMALVHDLLSAPYSNQDDLEVG